jgi:hypothetical protein
LASALNLPTTSQIIGANTGGGEVINGNLYEVLVYSKALTPAERQGVEGYLAWKWGFQTTLPSTHPYRNAPLAAPSTPTGLTGSLIVESAFRISWTGGAQATSYTYTLNGVAATPSTDNGTTSKSATFTGLSPLTQYTVVVTAVNAIGSATSSSVSVTTIADLTVKGGLQLWLDGKDQISMTITGTSTVTQWRDKSGFNYNTTSAVGTPQLGVNGITFDSSSYFNLANGCLPFNDTDFSMYIIVRSPSGNAGLLTAGNGFYIAYDVAGASLGFQGYNGGGTYMNVSVQSALAIYTITYSSSAGYNYRQYRNGTQSTNSSGTGPRNQTSSPNQLGTAAYPARGMIVGEMLSFNGTHTTTQRQDVEGYLAWKWGLQTQLPSNHPYRNSVPT